MVTGTGNPNLDVPAVQEAVDHGGSVVLRGHFFFDMPPPPAPGGSIYNRMGHSVKGGCDLRPQHANHRGWGLAIPH
jgi:hypothetical protein